MSAIRPATELAGLLRVGARGSLADEAAVELLIAHGAWLRRPDFVRACVDIWTSGDQAAAFVDWPAAARALDAGDLPCSSGEASVLRIAAGIGGTPVDLRAALGGLDARNILLVAEAVMHANGTPPHTLSGPSGAQPPSTTPGRPARPITQPKENHPHD